MVAAPIHARRGPRVRVGAGPPSGVPIYRLRSYRRMAAARPCRRGACRPERAAGFGQLYCNGGTCAQCSLGLVLLLVVFVVLLLRNRVRVLLCLRAC
eukprot:scaffold3089_cov136-Isochrysis_galbana.AAC.12